jgi:putative membrane protein
MPGARAGQFRRRLDARGGSAVGVETRPPVESRDMLAFAAVVSSLHVLALATGLPAVTLRGHALRGPFDDRAFRRMFVADTLWGVAAIVWLATGLLRAFGGLEKGSAFYLGSTLFWTKMALFLLVVLLEIYPMTMLIRWRIARRHGDAPDTSSARTLYVVNHVEMVLVVVIVFVASFMARGF